MEAKLSLQVEEEALLAAVQAGQPQGVDEDNKIERSMNYLFDV